MKFLPRIVPEPNLTKEPTFIRRRIRVMTALALTTFVSFGMITLDGCENPPFNIGPTKGQVVGVILGAAGVIGGTTAVLIEVHHKHHTVKGCVSSGANGLQVESDDKTYLLTGNTLNIKTDSLLKLHGTKLRKPKHSAAAPTFEVEKISKDYGPCRVSPNTSQSIADPKETLKAD